ncbi:MAG: helix-turn-helix transcriptional regulator [Pseudomonadota bacterium]
MDEDFYTEFWVNLIPAGLLVTDDRARILRFNDLAKTFVALIDKPVWRAGGGVCPALGIETTARLILEKILKTTDSDRWIYALYNSENHCMLDISCVKLPAAPGAGNFCVLLHNRSCPVTPSLERLRQLYAMTQMEGKITLNIVAGLSVGEIASQLFVQENTVRAHLKHIYEKVGARGQSDLVRQVIGNLLLCIPLDVPRCSSVVEQVQQRNVSFLPK